MKIILQIGGFKCTMMIRFRHSNVIVQHIILYYAMSCCGISFYYISVYRRIFYCIGLGYVVLYFSVLYYIACYLIIVPHLISCYFISYIMFSYFSYEIILCYSLLCYITLYFISLVYITFCYVMLSCNISWYVIVLFYFISC